MIYFKNETIKIRTIKEEDMPKLFAWWIDKETNHFDPRPLPSDLDSLLDTCNDFCKKFKEEVFNEDATKRIYKYFIIEDLKGYPIGFINLFNFNHEKSQCELGVVIGDKRYLRKGIAHQCLKAVIAYVFNHNIVDRIYVEIFESNLPSINLFQKVGFNKSGEYMDGTFKLIVMELNKRG